MQGREYRQETNYRRSADQRGRAGIQNQRYLSGQARIPRQHPQMDPGGRERRYKRRRKQQRRRTIFLVAVAALFLMGGRTLFSFLLDQLLYAGPVTEEADRGEQNSSFLNQLSGGLDATGEAGRENQDSFSVNQPLAGSAEAENVDAENLNEGVPDIRVDLSHLHSRYAILIDFRSGSSLSGYNAQKRIYPASLTKIMTAVLAVENTEDMEEVITVPGDFFPELYAEDASMAGFLPGERAHLRDLLYGILLPSGAECCMTFAYRIAGTEEAFVEMMNQKAEELGLDGTHFCNATGLHDPDHYSTVEDLAVLLRYALQSETFREAFTGSRYSTPPSDQHPDGFTFVSTMFQYMDSAEVPGGRILGGKTGYTEEAGQCLASLAEVNGREYILVTAQAPGSHTTEQFHILDAIDVYSQIGEQDAGSPG